MRERERERERVQRVCKLLKSKEGGRTWKMSVGTRKGQVSDMKGILSNDNETIIL
jgi:hypothetical protein